MTKARFLVNPLCLGFLIWKIELLSVLTLLGGDIVTLKLDIKILEKLE